MTNTDEPARRWLVGPPRWIFLGALLVTVAVSFCSAMPPGGLFDLFLLAACGWLALLITFVVRLNVALVIRAERRRFPRTIGLWLVFPLVLVGTFAVSSTRLPGYAALALARGDMLAYARDPGAAEPERVGPYEVHSAERLPGAGAQFHLKYAGFLNGTGWAYSPGGPPASVPDEITYTRINGPWYEFVRPF